MVTVPRPITGSIGSRIRVVFGKTGNDWLLLQNYDNGDRKWQVQNWNNIPHAVANQIHNCLAKDRIITSVDFGPDGAWFISGEKPDGTASHSWWGNTDASSRLKDWCSLPHTVNASFGSTSYGNETYAIIQGNNGYSLSGLLDDGINDRLNRIHNRKKTIKFVRLFDRGQYFVSDQEGTEWVIHNDYISTELNKNGLVNDLAIAEDGNWVVIRGDKYVASTGVDPDLKRALANFYSEQRRYGNERSAAIRAANETNERERLARERAAEEAREAAEREERERQAREAAERERMEREAAEREEREKARREAEREAAAQLEAATRISSLEATLEKRLTEEAADIKDTEEKLRNRKRSFQETLQSMSPATQSRLSLGNDSRSNVNNNRSTCVICQDEVAIMAVSPCGHVCLCNNCADVCMGGHATQRKCPLCRGNMSSVLRIYLGN